MGLEGSIEEFGLADILQLIYFQKKTGLLEVEGRLGRVKIFFNNGNVVGAESKHRLEQKRLGRILVKKGLLAEEELEGMLRKQKASGERFGSILLKNKNITKEDVRDVILNQMTETIIQIFGWKKGTYEFRPHRVTVDRDLDIAVDTQHLLMDGLRIIDEWSVIEGRLTLDTVFERTGVSDAELTEEEQKILRCIDGETDVSSTCEISGMDDRDASRVLVSLLDKGVIRTAEEKSYVAEKAEGRSRRGLKMPMLAIAANLVIAASLVISLGPLKVRPVPGDAARAEIALEKLRLSIERERFLKGAYPETLPGTVEAHRDPWGGLFDYRRTDVGYELVSPGPDGVPGTPDDIY